MEFRLDFHEDVATDYLQAYSWYEDNKIGLGDRFLAKLREKLAQIAQNPEALVRRLKADIAEQQ